ncbi:MAG: DUF1269 domain-containing protein [Gemmatimonadaceae bacterium]|nr:DUF1269 domain-containing protein [Gloeobacterales cyanobacterium ES-bin-141]
MAEVWRAIGVFHTHTQVERALSELRKADFDLSNVSILLRREDEPVEPEHVPVEDAVSNGATAGAALGSIAGGLAGLVFGLGSAVVAGVGTVLTAGTIGTAIVAALSGGTLGAAAGGMTGALVGLGIPEGQAETYAQTVKDGCCLMIVEGNPAELRKIEPILQDCKMENYRLYEVLTETAERESTRMV